MLEFVFRIQVIDNFSFSFKENIWKYGKVPFLWGYSLQIFWVQIFIKYKGFVLNHHHKILVAKKYFRGYTPKIQFIDFDYWKNRWLSRGKQTPVKFIFMEDLCLPLITQFFASTRRSHQTFFFSLPLTVRDSKIYFSETRSMEKRFPQTKLIQLRSKVWPSRTSKAWR